MVSGIGSISNIGSSLSVSSIQQPLTPETKSKLENLGIDTTNIKTETQGQEALQSAQSSQQGQETQKNQESQKGQAGGNQAAMQALKSQAEALASKVGVSVSSDDKLSDIMDKISQALSTMQAQAANDPQKLTQIAQYQTEFDSINQSASNLQTSMQISAQSGASQIQNSMTGLAIYNMASMSISNSNTDNLQKH